MDLSNIAILVLSIFVLIAVIAALFYILRGIRRNRKSPTEKPYNWQPEQDYDVKYSDEGPLTPPWPTLKRRQKPDNKLSDKP